MSLRVLSILLAVIARAVAGTPNESSPSGVKVSTKGSVRQGGKSTVQIAFARRTRKYGCPGEAILVLRIEGTTPHAVRKEAKLRLMVAGRPHEAVAVQTAGERKRFKDRNVVVTKPWIVLAFTVPDEATAMRLVLGDSCPVPVPAASEVSNQIECFHIPSPAPRSAARPALPPGGTL